MRANSQWQHVERFARLSMHNFWYSGVREELIQVGNSFPAPRQ